MEDPIPVRVALTRFAVDRVQRILVKEAEAAVKPDHGLHTARKPTADAPEGERLQWVDIGATTFKTATGIIQQHQPLLWDLLVSVADRNAKKLPTGADNLDPVTLRERRPPELVVSNAISSLDFSRTNRASLVPSANGFLYFSLCAHAEQFSYTSRLGLTPAYSTILHMLTRLGEEDAAYVRELGARPETAVCIITENVQNYLRQRDACVGRVSGISIGMAATFVEMPHVSPSALDFDDKQRRLDENLRASVTVTQLLKLIDQDHLRTVGTLGLLRTLVDYIPELARLSPRRKEDPAGPHASPVHPLGSCAKNETITSELKDALIDFLDQTGQDNTKPKRRVTFVVGDGLTFDRTIQLKNYLRFHDNDFESFRTIEPVLAPWHTAWTDLSRIVSTHWDNLVTKDPSKLGYSAAKLHRRPPSNLKKPDFNQALEIVETTHDAHILDCFRVYYSCDDIFTHFSSLETVPPFKSLGRDAANVYHMFCTHLAGERALACDIGAHITVDTAPAAAGFATAHPAPITQTETGPIASPYGASLQDSETGTPIPVADARARATVTALTLEGGTSGLALTPGTTRSSSALPSTAPVHFHNREDCAAGCKTGQSCIPQGTPWPALVLPPGPAALVAVESDGASSDLATPPTAKKGKKSQKPPKPFNGDRVLADAIDFMRETLTLRECLFAIDEGDVGRIYEAMKVMLFTFAGSPHGNYTSYLLEFFCALELESSEELRRAILSSLVVNIKGRPGSFAAADLIQEYFNRLLQAIAERKGAEYNSPFLRNVVSRNLHHLSRLRGDLGAGPRLLLILACRLGYRSYEHVT
ncbi:uncharacterized protein BXZ73DRAFT_84309 [Epithele typhae]|uniref:uncharacterized protein n=1 Tax=Epithele typhae TaxID=378194 RepID=UPI002008CA0A|nr:uncharacterized protein BXZ73DRAFT_84309 [Epithele typhae]KAH9908260.1 hypothetical protein BXZ73DRAFT_84309 [Epithele typhae]